MKKSKGRKSHNTEISAAMAYETLSYWKHQAKCYEEAMFFWLDHAKKLETRAMAYQDIIKRARRGIATEYYWGDIARILDEVDKLDKEQL